MPPEKAGVDVELSTDSFATNRKDSQSAILATVPSLNVLLIEGENIQHYGTSRDAQFFISDYRLVVRFDHQTVVFPIGAIELIEPRELYSCFVSTKFGPCVALYFESQSDCDVTIEQFNQVIASRKKISEVFAFQYRCNLCKQRTESRSDDMEDALFRIRCFDEKVSNYFESEIRRMGFDLKEVWRVSSINSDYKMCDSYPKQIIVPQWVKEDELKVVVTKRVKGRIPAVVYRHRANGAVLVRSSQLQMAMKDIVGYATASSTLSNEDVNLLQCISQASSCESHTFTQNFELVDGFLNEQSLPPPKCFLIIDCRSWTAAIGNIFKTGGFEKDYPNCEIRWQDLVNIHKIKTSFNSLRTVLSSPQSSFFSQIESTQWLQNLQLLLKAASVAADAIANESRPVLVHCSDGWDRTAQVVSLTEIMLDPFYRTILGFQILIQREWLDFGHKFGDRCQREALSEQCPIFIQWLDAVYQLTNQFPLAFEFNEVFLIKLAQHVYSNMFGTFLCNSMQEREQEKIYSTTCSLWCFVRNNRRKFKNTLYLPHDRVLFPSANIAALVVWRNLYGSPRLEPCQPGLLCDSIIDDDYHNHDDSSPENGVRCKSLENVTADNGAFLIHRSNSQCSLNGSSPSKENLNRTFPLIKRGNSYVCEQSTSTTDLTPSSIPKFHAFNSYSDLTDARREDKAHSEKCSSAMDLDGLIKIRIPMLTRLRALDYEHRREVDRLKLKIHRLTNMIKNNQQEKHAIDTLLQNELSSLEVANDQMPSSPSDVSSGWEHVSKGDTLSVRWVPDHAAHMCQGCNSTLFSTLNRRHHCRSCGNVFCGTCSKYTAPVPSEELHTPVRVCKKCYDSLSLVAINGS